MTARPPIRAPSACSTWSTRWASPSSARRRSSSTPAATREYARPPPTTCRRCAPSRRPARRWWPRVRLGVRQRQGRRASGVDLGRHRPVRLPGRRRPDSPVRRGEIQRPGLGMDMDVVDDSGETLPPGIEGELVCRSPFPSTPLRFWDDPDEARYRAAYFERIDGVWHHGDFASRTPSGGFVISGRSDATLNPGGVRIGTAEIYRGSTRCRRSTRASRSASRRRRHPHRAVRQDVIRTRADRRAPRRDPQPDPRRAVPPPRARGDRRGGRHSPTRSGKMTETAVRDVICGRPVRNTSAMANPEALEHFRDRPELA